MLYLLSAVRSTLTLLDLVNLPDEFLIHSFQARVAAQVLVDSNLFLSVSILLIAMLNEALIQCVLRSL